MDKNQIIEKISEHIRTRGGLPGKWYLGISQYPEGRLLVDHQLDMEKDKFILIPANSAQEANEILDYFVNWIGTDGRLGGENHGARKIYAYKKSEGTNP